MRLISLFWIIFFAPFAGILYSLHTHDSLGPFLNPDSLISDLTQVSAKVVAVQNMGESVKEQAGLIDISIVEQEQQFKQQQELIADLIARGQEQEQLSKELYEQQLLQRLGTPVDSFTSARVELLLFEINQGTYRGYMVKAKLLDPEAILVSLGQGEYGKSEITSQAVARKGGIFGINGGGFYNTVQDGKNYTLPIGNTVIDERLITGFIPSRDDIFFSGFSDGSLVGGIVKEKEQLNKLATQWGISFVPMLLQDRIPQEIPARWRNARHPRTIIGNFSNGDLFFMVIDGRQAGWSRGATLEEIQLKLLQLGVVDAYNLDGGGSSTMVFKGKVINRPSENRERPVATNIIITP